MSDFGAVPRLTRNSSQPHFVARPVTQTEVKQPPPGFRGSSNVLNRSRRRRPSASSSTVSSAPTFLSSRSRASHSGAHPSFAIPSPPRSESPPPSGCCGLWKTRRSRGHSSEGVVSQDAPSAASCRTTDEWSPVGAGATAWHSLIDFSTARHHGPGSSARSGSSSTSGSHLGLGRHADHQDFVLMDMRPALPALPPRQRHHSMGAAAPSRPPPPRYIPRPPSQPRLLVRCLDKIYACPYYWGFIDSREAERRLKSQANGTYLLRDSAHDNYLFTISYRWDAIIKHIRIEVRRGKYSLNDRMTFKSPVDLVEFYRNAQHEAAVAAAGLISHGGHNGDEVSRLLKPVMRDEVFSLAKLSRSVVTTRIASYRALEELHLPPTLLDYLRHYSYKDIP